jgi:hypothetical protein
MVSPLGALPVSPAAATTEVGDVNGGPLGGATSISDSGHHRSWRRRWQASCGVLTVFLASATTEVGDVDGGPPWGALPVFLTAGTTEVRDVDSGPLERCYW